MAHVDTSVLIDLVLVHSPWRVWAETVLLEHQAQGELRIDPVVYAEFSIAMPSRDALDVMLDHTGIRLMGTPREALFLAGRAHRDYRARGGQRAAILPDFIVGAHAWVGDGVLITRDPRRFQRAFPRLKLVHPSGAEQG